MGALVDPKHETLAQELGKGSTQAAAYLAAGYSGKNNNVASVQCNKLLKKHPEISARVNELKQIARDQIATSDFMGDIETFTRMYLEDRLFAQQCNQPGAAVSATNGLLKLYGLGEETVRHKGGIENKISIDPSKLSDKTMEELLDARRRSDSQSG